MFYVYILRSIGYPDEVYIGATSDLKGRLAAHNAGKSAHTAKRAPWEIACYFAFPAKETAYSFEAYLKSHSGCAFARKRLLATAYGS
jgi:putative endonuclease